MTRRGWRRHYAAGGMARATQTRVAITVRLPYDQYREVVARAQGREWSIAHYVSHCIGRELGSKATKGHNRGVALAREVSDADE